MAWSSPRTWTTAEVVTAAHMNQEIRDNFNAAFPDGVGGVSWTPGLAGTSENPAVTTVGRRRRVLGVQQVWARMTITSVGGGAGFYFVTLPTSAVGLSAFAAEGSGQTVGSWTARDSSLVSSATGSVILRATDEIWFDIGPNLLSDTNPWVFTTDDILSFDATYPIA